VCAGRQRQLAQVGALTQLAHGTRQRGNASLNLRHANRRKAQAKVGAGTWRLCKKYRTSLNQHTVLACHVGQLARVDSNRCLQPQRSTATRLREAEVWQVPLQGGPRHGQALQHVLVDAPGVRLVVPE
jgi:hypothetical protein